MHTTGQKHVLIKKYKYIFIIFLGGGRRKTAILFLKRLI